jgi:hypothetical protein
VDNIKRTVQRIVSDLRARRNIEDYVVSAIAIVFAVLTVAGDLVSDSLKMAAILSALGLLVFHLTVPEQAALSLDEILNDRSHFPPLPERIKGARKLWIYGPSAVNVLSQENTLAIKNEILSHADGEFRVIIQDPDAKEAVNILIQQLDKPLDFQLQELPAAIQITLSILHKLAGWKVSGTFEYRLLPFNPGFSMVVIDPDKNSGLVIVEFYGFYHEHTASRMNIEITRSQSERWFTYWVSQFDRMWEAARQPESAEDKG